MILKEIIIRISAWDENGLDLDNFLQSLITILIVIVSGS